MLSFNDLVTLDPDGIWLELEFKDQKEAWKDSERRPYSNDAARGRAYLNDLSLRIIERWLAEELAQDVEEPFEIWPNRDELPSFWEILDGTVVKLGETRLAIFPSETLNFEELCVPQEWVDIPEWAADYYLAVQVNLTDDWARIWGYATHNWLKQHGKYDRYDRTYNLSRQSLSEDINLMWVARELSLTRQPEVEPLPELSDAEATELLAGLSQPSPYSPRLDVPFERWGVLMAKPEWRQQLYRNRAMPEAVAQLQSLSKDAELNLQEVANIETSVMETKPDSLQQSEKRQKPPEQPREKLTQRVQGLFETGWQILENALISPEAAWAEAKGKGVDEIIMRKKTLGLGQDAVDLAIRIEPIPARERFDVWIWVQSTDERTPIPENLELSAVDELGTRSKRVRAKAQLASQGLHCEAPLGAQLNIQVVLGGTVLTEKVEISSFMPKS